MRSTYFFLLFQRGYIFHEKYHLEACFFFVKEVPLIVFDIEFIIKENENTFFFFFKEFMFVKN